MPIVGVNNRLPILHMFKIMVYCYNTNETMNKFAIGYMITPSLQFNNAFRTHVGKLISAYLSDWTTKTILKI